MAATRKTEKYSTLSSVYRFEPIAVENLGVFGSTTLNFVSELGRRICVHTGDVRDANSGTVSALDLPTYTVSGKNVTNNVLGISLTNTNV